MPNSVAFIRTKYIKGNPYAYLVENTWKKKGSRQKVNKYLGRILERDEREAPSVPDDLPADHIIRHLLDKELESLDVKADMNKRTVTKNGKTVVVSMNGGYLCDHTLKALLKARHARNEERPGLALADAFSRAGISIPPQASVRLYRSLR